MGIERPAEFVSGHNTAKKAAALLVAKKAGFIVPTAHERQNLVVAFAKKGKVVYGRAFDVVKIDVGLSLKDLADVERHLEHIVVFEIKSTRKKLRSDFSNYFFGLTGAEVLVAQSLKKQFKFVLVNTSSGEYLELSLAEIFSRAKGIYPTWSICF